MQTPLVSVVIPTYKRNPSLISKSINSVLNQSYSNLELIIVDDSPKNYENRDSVEKYISMIGDDRISYIQHEKNLGANAARNTGIKASKGEFIGFLDDDDEWHHDKLKLQVEKILINKVALVYCRGEIVDKDGNYIKEVGNELKKGMLFDELMHKNFIGGNSFVLIRREVLQIVGIFDENMQSNQDWELFLRIAKMFEIDFVDKNLVKYYIYDDGNISSNPKKKLQGLLYMKEMYADYLASNPNIENEWNLVSTISYFKDKQYFKVLKIFLKAILYSPSAFISFINEVYKSKIPR